MAYVLTILNLAFWSAFAFFVCPRAGLPIWFGYALGLALVAIRGNMRAAKEARRLPSMKDLS